MLKFLLLLILNSCSPAFAAYQNEVNVGNFPAVQPVSQNGTWSTRTQDGAGAAITSSSVLSKQALDVFAVGVTTAQVADSNASGSLTAACPTGLSCPVGSTIEMSITGVSAGILDLTGTWTGTVFVDGSMDDFATFRTIALWTPSDGLLTSGVTVVGLYRTSAIAGFKKIRVRASVLSSGTVVAQLGASVGVGPIIPLSPNASSNKVQIYGSESTTPLLTTAGVLSVSGPLTDTQLRATPVPVSGTVTANLGTIAGVATESTLSAISGFVDQLEGYLDGVEASLTSLISNTTGLALQSGANTFLDKTSSGTITLTVVDSLVSINPNGASSAGVQITGTWSGTLQYECTLNGTDYFSLASLPYSSTGASTTSTTGNTQVRFPVSTCTTFRVRRSAGTSGTASVTIIASSGESIMWAFSQNANNFITANVQSGSWTMQPGNTANTTPWLFTINQGGNSASVSASNALKVDGSAVTQPISAASLPLPTGASTSANQSTAIASLASIDSKLSWLYTRIVTATTTTVKSGAGVLSKVCINTPTNGTTITMYDNTTATTPLIGIITLVNGQVPNCMNYEGITFNTGLTIVTNTTADLTIVYR